MNDIRDTARRFPAQPRSRTSNPFDFRGIAGSFAALASLSLFLACGGGDPRDDSGAITESANIAALSPRVGDCFDDSQDVAGERSFDSIDVLPCSEPHDNEIYAAIDYVLVEDDIDIYPGLEVLDEFAVLACFDAFEPFVGLNYQQSRFDYSWITPTNEGWGDHDDHEVLCVLWHIDLQKLEGSVKGTRE